MRANTATLNVYDRLEGAEEGRATRETNWSAIKALSSNGGEATGAGHPHRGADAADRAPRPLPIAVILAPLTRDHMGARR